MPGTVNSSKGPKASSRNWHALNPLLSPWILEAVDAMGFSVMTPVQASTIPLFMGHKDVVVEAVTGSGKTLSFLIPIVERILRLDGPTKKHHVASIVVAPTRELAIQIDSVLRSLTAFHPASAAIQKHLADSNDAEAEEHAAQFPSAPRIVSQLLISGTVSPSEDAQRFVEQSPNVLIATPGRLLELLSSPRVHCPQSSFEVLVLDEADRLLDLGFKDDLQRILGRLPKQRRTGLFSASVSEALDQLIRVGLRNPVRISVRVKSKSGRPDQRTPISLDMTYVVTKPSEKLPVLFKILATVQPTPLRTIVYMSTCAGVDYFQHVLSPLLAQQDPSFTLIPLHGKQTPQVRQKNFGRFSEAISPTVLLTTDVAARGLDIPQVDFVAQIDPPLDPKVFLHRCGRAGRAGRKGLAVVFLQPGREEDYIPFLEVRQTPITPLQLPAIAASSDDSAALSASIRDIVRGDRALFDKAQRGFVSWVQSYRKHQARSIFRLDDVDWTDLAHAWGLLKMPRMPELKHWTGDRGLGIDMDFAAYGYRDKQREKQRRAEMEAPPVSGADKNSAASAQGAQPTKRAWSDKLDHKDEREKRRAVKQAKRERARLEQMTPEEHAKEAELAALIEKARGLQKQARDEDGGFEGFSD